MKCIDKVVWTMGVMLVSLTALAAKSDKNCQSMAVEMTLGVNQQFSLVREWDDSLTPTFVPKPYVDEWGKQQPGYVTNVEANCWLDRYEDDEDLTKEQNASNYWGGCWLYVKTTRDKDYVFSCPAETPLVLFDEKTDSAGISFGKPRLINGTNYYCIAADDWLPKAYPDDPDDFEFYVHVFGMRNTVDQKVLLSFQQKTLSECFPASEAPGSVKNPHPLDVSTSGSHVIDESPEMLWDNRYRTTAYTIQIQPGETYTFTATGPASGQSVYFKLPDSEWDKVEGKASVKVRENPFSLPTKLIVQDVKEVYDLTFVVHLSNDYGVLSAAGGIMNWRLGSSPAAAPLSAGTYHATLVGEAVGEPAVTASVDVVAKIMNDGTTNFAASVTIGGVTNEFSDCGQSTVVHGEEPNESWLRCSLSSLESLSVEGTIWVGKIEYWFGGVMNGAQNSWDDSFLATDQDGLRLLITKGGFKAASSDTVQKLLNWGRFNNVGISEVNDEKLMFSTLGDPVLVENGEHAYLIAEAFLLDCAPTEAAVEAAKREFVITSFDPVSKEVIVAGKWTEKDAYGNGKVNVRVAESPEGPYGDTVPDGAAAFYRAYLVK